jgi:hypothetical protein
VPGRDGAVAVALKLERSVRILMHTTEIDEHVGRRVFMKGVAGIVEKLISAARRELLEAACIHRAMCHV